MARRLSLVFIALLIVAIFQITVPIKTSYAAGLALEGEASEGVNCNLTCATITVTRTGTDDICFVSVEINADSSASVTSDLKNTGGGTDLTEVGSIQPNVGFPYEDTFSNPYSVSGATITFTITMSAQANVAIVAMCISGADIVTIFDTDLLKGECGASGASSTNPSCSPITTLNPNDMLLGFVGFHGACPNLVMGSGFTNIATQAAGANVCESDQYEIVSSTQNGITQSMTQSGTTQAWDFKTVAICQSTCGQVTVPVQCSLSPTSAAQPKISFQSSGVGSIIPDSITCNGTIQNIAAPANVAFEAQNPASSSSSGYAFSASNPLIIKYGATCASGTCATWTFTDFFELVINNPTSLGIAYTLAGSPGSGNINPDGTPGGTSALADSGSSLTVSGQYSNTFVLTHTIWIYQENSTGIQIYGDQALTGITYNTANLFIKFSQTNPLTAAGGFSTCRCQGFVPPILGLTLNNVYNNGVVNTAATFNNNMIDETGISPHEWDLASVSPMSQSTTQMLQGTSTQSAAGGGGAGPPIFQIQFTTTTATILNQPVVLTYPVFGNPALIGFGLSIIAAVLVVVFVGFALNSRRSRRREYTVERHF